MGLQGAGERRAARQEERDDEQDHAPEHDEREKDHPSGDQEDDEASTEEGYEACRAHQETRPPTPLAGFLFLTAPRARGFPGHVPHSESGYLMAASKGGSCTNVLYKASSWKSLYKSLRSPSLHCNGKRGGFESLRNATLSDDHKGHVGACRLLLKFIAGVAAKSPLEGVDYRS